MSDILPKTIGDMIQSGGRPVQSATTGVSDRPEASHYHARPISISAWLFCVSPVVRKRSFLTIGREQAYLPASSAP